MADNKFLSPEKIAATGLELLRRELILPRLVSRLGLADFKGAKDDTVNIRVPAILTAREYEFRTRSAPIQLDTIEELSIPVKLDKHVYSAVAVTDEELTLDIVDFGAQVLLPQVIAVAEKLESYLAAVMAAATFAAGPVTYQEDPDSANFYNALVDARKILNDFNVPLVGRAVVVGSSVEAAALKETGIRNASESGSTDALRRAQLGSIAGFDIFVSNSVPEDFAVAFHRTAFAFANVAPEVPAGATFGQSATDNGLSMRWLRDYDPTYLRDRSVVSAYAGAASVNDAQDDSGLTDENKRAVAITFTPAGS